MIGIPLNRKGARQQAIRLMVVDLALIMHIGYTTDDLYNLAGIEREPVFTGHHARHSS
jgi:hypothetical protein